MKSFSKPYCIQDNYPEQYCHCYGCGRKNMQGLKIKSYWDGEKALARFTPEQHHIALPGYVYGGLLASLIDCHGIATASAAMSDLKNDTGNVCLELKRYVTASLHVDYLRPTPIGTEIEMIGIVAENTGRKVKIKVELFAGGKQRARGEVLAAPVPDSMI